MGKRLHAIWHEGANIISADRLNEFRGHFTKVTLAGASPIVGRLMISPEQVVSGEIAAYDPAKHDLRVNTAMGSKGFPIGVDAWCHLGPKTVDSASLANYIGHNVKMTVAADWSRALRICVEEVWVKKTATACQRGKRNLDQIRSCRTHGALKSDFEVIRAAAKNVYFEPPPDKVRVYLPSLAGILT
jgi:hypothetical protein